MDALDPPDFRLLPDDVLIDEELTVDAAAGTGDQDGMPPDAPAPLTLRTKLFAAVILGALAASGLAVQLHRSRSASAPGAAPAAATPIARWTNPRPWPLGIDGCGNEVRLPVVEADQSSAPTGLSITVGTISLLTGRLDTGELDNGLGRPAIKLSEQSYLTDQVTSGGRTYAEVVDCSAGSRIIRVDPDGRQVSVLTDPITRGLLPDGTGGVWTARFGSGGATIGEAKLQVVLHRLDRPGEVALPALTFPFAIRGRLVYGEQQPLGGLPARLVAFDLTDHAITRDLGAYDSAAIVDGELLWLPVPCSGTSPCSLDQVDLATGSVLGRGWTLPAGFRVNAGVLSPDHRRLAVQLPDDVSDPQYARPGSSLPSQVAVLELDTGRVSRITELRIPPGGRVGFAFAPDSQRLVLAVPSAGGTDFFVWAFGMSRPQQTEFRLPTALPTPAYLRVADTGPPD